MANTDELKTSSHDGIAKIKSEYVILDPKRKLNFEFISEEDKIKCFDNNVDLPPKKRLKGQNKHRPREARIPRHEKFCPCLIETGTCSYGDNCYYLHEGADFLAKKPDDIKNDCYLFNTYGKCIYGITCRFGSQHLGEDGKNIINEKLQEEWKNFRPCKNFLTKALQMELRKHRYDFSKANSAVKQIRSGSIPKASSNDENSTLKPEPNEPDVAGSRENTWPSEITEGSCRGPSDDVEAVPKSQNFTCGSLTDEDIIKTRPSEKKHIDFTKKLYLAPLTTVGNLPFRRICKRFGADITCGEMAVAQNLLQGQQSEWALVKRHHSEDIFGIQVSGAHGDLMTRCAQLLSENTEVDFVDINVGCPIDLIYKKGGGCALMNRTRKLEEMVIGMKSVLTVPLTAKIRTGVHENKNTALSLIPNLRSWGLSLVSIHGRSREQRYTKSADWHYIKECAEAARPMLLFGNGDILSYEDYNHYLDFSGVDGIMIGRGALFKPWIFTEIKEQRHYDISSQERFDILKDYVNYGLEHWGADTEGVEKTRRFLLEWLSFLYRYVPIGLLERVPQKINERPPCYVGRNDLETLMASPNCGDWIKISEMFLGPVSKNFSFLPKHKANSYR